MHRFHSKSLQPNAHCNIFMSKKLYVIKIQKFILILTKIKECMNVIILWLDLTKYASGIYNYIYCIIYYILYI